MKSSILKLAFFVICMNYSGCYGLTCLSCLNSPIPRDCQYTVDCGPHEICYSSSFVSPAGAISYQLGCKDFKLCGSTIGRKSSGELLVCSECCNGTLCNSGLCGQIGIPSMSPETRGPIFYSCDQQLSPGSCHVIRQCGRDEECILEQFTSQMGHDLIYKTNCEKKTVCNERLRQLQGEVIPDHIVGRRYERKSLSIASDNAQNRCLLKCCGQDLCNSDCTGTRVVLHANSSTLPTTRGTPSATTAKVTHSSSIPVTTLVATQEPCYDKTNCTSYLHYCHSKQYEDWMNQQCRKSCNLCNSNCYDMADCSQHLQYCSTQKEWAFINCRKACGLCNEVVNVNSTMDPACSQPDVYDYQYCKSVAQYCNDPRYNTRIVCRHFCGHCSN